MREKTQSDVVSESRLWEGRSDQRHRLPLARDDKQQTAALRLRLILTSLNASLTCAICVRNNRRDIVKARVASTSVWSYGTS